MLRRERLRVTALTVASSDYADLRASGAAGLF